MRWTSERAWEWYRGLPWLCGFNYVPSTAVNSTAMWQQKTFDLPTIERELSWAQEIGFNCCRVFLQYLVWEADAEGFRQRFAQLLEVVSSRGLRTLPILFDDCAFAGKEPYLGLQDEPIPGIHNSGWTASPGRSRVLDESYWPRLEDYVTDTIGQFARDERILAWDIYNEPGNDDMGVKSLPLLRIAFDWAYEAQPTQPLTTGIWSGNLPEINAALGELCDIVSFHDYFVLEATQKLVEELKGLGRPLLCTEWMRRGHGSHFETHLPYFRSENIGSFFWGLVNGHTQTHFPWGSS
ncbi:MAG: hypothetical protein JOZ57_04995, partial [Abitibacteriaceae bacterium]|nr:hypothetical protein [Abditibacteriaceae bacterium]